MTPFEKQFIALKEVYPEAQPPKSLPDGSFSITLPNFPLPEGWSASSTTVRFIVPVGYPAARPDCFWTDPLTLASKAAPMNTGANQMPGEQEGLLWYSWHVANWSPNHDTLVTYVKVIERRFETRQ